MKFRACIYKPLIDGDRIYASENRKIGLYKLPDKIKEKSCNIPGDKYGQVVIIDIEPEEYGIPLMIGMHKTFSNDRETYDFVMEDIPVKSIIFCEDVNKPNDMLYNIINVCDKEYNNLAKHIYEIMDYVDNYLATSKFDIIIKNDLIKNLVKIVGIVEKEEDKLHSGKKVSRTNKIDDYINNYTSNKLYEVYRDYIVNGYLDAVINK